jgi:hypothetical protein
MNRVLLVIAVGFVGAGTIFAAEEAPRIELKNTSSFEVPDNSRNPFWPIGWTPPPRGQVSTTEHTAGPDVNASAFALSSITVDHGTRFAIINGKVMQEGQQFGLQMGTATLQITLKAIQDGQVVLLRRDQEIVVPLRRK